MKRKNFFRSAVVAGCLVLLFSLFLVSCETMKETETISAPQAPAVTAPSEQVAVEEQAAKKEGLTEAELAEQKLLEEIKAFEWEKIYFDYDKYDLKADARDVLNRKAAWLKANSGLSVLVEGHCDERGTNEYNLALGERRAKAAYNFLVTLGVPADRLSVISYGEEMPAELGQNDEAWAKNRRDEFKVQR